MLRSRSSSSPAKEKSKEEKDDETQQNGMSIGPPIGLLPVSTNPMDNPALASILTKLGTIPNQTSESFSSNGVHSSLASNVSGQLAAHAAIAASVLKESKELFVGNVLATGISDVVLKDFLNAALRQVGLVSGAEDAITGIRMNTKFSFIEFRTVDDCTNALNLNGIPFMGAMLKIGRPAKYSGPHAHSKTWQEMTGQTVPSGIVMSSLIQSDPQTKVYREIFVGNTTAEMTETSLRDFIGGALQRMGLCSCDNESPIAAVRVNAKFSFLEFKTMEDAANVLNLNGIPFGGVSLKICRPAKFEIPSFASFYTWDDLLARWMTGELKLLTAGAASKVLCITNMVSKADLEDQDLFNEMIEDTKEECSQWGIVSSVIVPRPDSQQSIGVGRLFVEMASAEDAKTVLVALKGRTFDGRTVDVKFYSQEAFNSNDYGMAFPPLIVTTTGLSSIDAIFNRR